VAALDVFGRENAGGNGTARHAASSAKKRIASTEHIKGWRATTGGCAVVFALSVGAGVMAKGYSAGSAGNRTKTHRGVA